MRMIGVFAAGLVCAAMPAPGAGDEKPRAAEDAKRRVVIVTNLGEIVLELDRAKAPLTVANFLAYVEAKHYDGSVFHRVIDNFMIQGGGLDEEMREKPTKAPIKNESANGLKNLRSTIAMARTQDPDSAAGQFFINVKDNDFLNGTDERPGYAVFGRVTGGMDTVDKIKGVRTRSVGAMQDVPEEPVVIKSARRIAAAK